MKRASLLLLALALPGCKTMDEMVKGATGAAADKGYISGSTAKSIQKGATALRKSAEEISESEEYYIGRAVAAQILSQYKPERSEEMNKYVRTLGAAIAMASDRPALYNGWRFQVLDSDEPNAFAAPGGFIFVTRGLVKKAASEDELAAALAHEAAHVSLKHGLKTIKTARLTSAFSILATEAAKNYTSEEVGKLTEAFEGAIDDVVQNLVVNGYSRDKEYEADKVGAEIARRAGYDPTALARLVGKLDGGSGGLMKTHPSSASRVERLAGVAKPTGYKPSKVRDQRFARAVR